MMKKYALMGLLIMNCLGSNLSQAGIFSAFSGTFKQWWYRPSDLGAGETVGYLGVTQPDNEYIYAIYHEDKTKRSFPFIRRVVVKKVTPKEIYENIFLLQSSKRHSRFPDKWVTKEHGMHASSAFTYFNTEDVKKEVRSFKTFEFLNGELARDAFVTVLGKELVCYLLFKNNGFLSTPNGVRLWMDSDKTGYNTPAFGKNDQPYIATFTDVLLGEGEDAEDKLYSISFVNHLLVKKLNLRTGECENVMFKDLPANVREAFSQQ